MRSRLVTASLAAVMLLCVCTPAHAVLGGSAIATPGFMAYVVARQANGLSEVCGGAAVARNVVVTTAHCIVDGSTGKLIARQRIGAIVGRANPGRLLGRQAGALNEVVGYVVDPAFSRGDDAPTHDVAILRMREPIAQPISVLSRSRASLVAPGRSAALLGWGTTRAGVSASSPELVSGPLRLTRSAECGARFATWDADVMLCATGVRGTTPCAGDSGGPLIVTDTTGGAHLAGLVSFGAVDCPVGVPFVFADLAGPALGALVSKAVTSLQKQADAAGESRLPRGETTEKAIAWSRARTRITEAIRRATGHAPSVTRFGCYRLTFTSYECEPRWHDAARTYEGTLSLTADSVSFSGTRATRACRARAGWKRCGAAFRFRG